MWGGGDCCSARVKELERREEFDNNLSKSPYVIVVQPLVGSRFLHAICKLDGHCEIILIFFNRHCDVIVK